MTRIRLTGALGLTAFLACASCTKRQPVIVPVPRADSAQSTQAPSTDIYLYRLGRLLPFVNRLVNITNRIGYDNQPSWDGPSLLYTVQNEGQTDIYRYRDGNRTQVTATPESEYSAALTPDGDAFSVVRVERDSAQRLWRFPKDGSPPGLVLRDIKPVGYFAWLDSTTLALFVLGTPNTLQIADTRTGTARVVTTNIGRSLQRVPGGRRASFIHRVGARWRLEIVDPVPRAGGSFDIDTVATLPDSADYVVWRSETELYTATGSRILRLHLPDRTWTLVADLEDRGIRRISRLALSQGGATLAFVADEPRPVEGEKPRTPKP